MTRVRISPSKGHYNKTFHSQYTRQSLSPANAKQIDPDKQKLKNPFLNLVKEAGL
jgi:hypothetical protein